MWQTTSGRDRAVSAVVGVVLMVAITVLLAAVLGVLSIGFTERVDETPTVRLEFEPMERSGQPDELRVEHAGGELVPNTKLYVTAAEGQLQDDDGSAVAGQSSRFSWYDLAADDGASSDELLGAGDSVTVEPPNSDPELDDRVVRVVWSSDGGSTVLATFRGRDVDG